jgi:hypothetical protein
MEDITTSVGNTRGLVSNLKGRNTCQALPRKWTSVLSTVHLMVIWCSVTGCACLSGTAIISHVMLTRSSRNYKYMTLPLTPRNAKILHSLPVLGHESSAHKKAEPNKVKCSLLVRHCKFSAVHRIHTTFRDMTNTHSIFSQM